MTQPSEGQRRQELLFALEELQRVYVGISDSDGTMLLVMRLIDVLKKGL